MQGVKNPLLNGVVKGHLCCAEAGCVLLRKEKITLFFSDKIRSFATIAPKGSPVRLCMERFEHDSVGHLDLTRHLFCDRGEFHPPSYIKSKNLPSMAHNANVMPLSCDRVEKSDLQDKDTPVVFNANPHRGLGTYISNLICFCHIVLYIF